MKKIKQPDLSDFIFKGEREGYIFTNFAAYELSIIAYKINTELPDNEEVIIRPSTDGNIFITYIKNGERYIKEANYPLMALNVRETIKNINLSKENQIVEKSAFVTEQEIKDIRKVLDWYRMVLTNAGLKHWEMNCEEVSAYYAIVQIEKRFE